MTAYGCWLWVQSLLALAALGLAGAWALRPFRSAVRPYLWLAAPLAGVAVLSAALSLGRALGLRLPGALALGFVPAALLSLAGAAPPRRGAGWVLLAGLGVSLWATWACNRSALARGEPTVYLLDGSDAAGYALFADWVLTRPGQQAAFRPDRPCEAYINLLGRYESRRGAFLLAGAAAWARGTSALFSYDWASGVVLAAGVLGVAGWFGSRRTGLVLLLAAGVTSSWLFTGRAGYFGKALAYPGTLLLAGLLLELWRRANGARMAAAGLLGAGVALCLHPMVSQAVLGLVYLGALAPRVLDRLAGPTPGRGEARRLLGVSALLAAGVAAGLSRQPGPFTAGLVLVGVSALLALRRARSPSLPPELRADWAHLLAGLGAYLLLCGPLLAYWRWAVPEYACPAPAVEWPRLFPIALDLDNPAVPLVGHRHPSLLTGLVLLALGVQVLLAVLAWRGGQPGAAGLLLSGGLVPLAWFASRTEVFEFHGLLFPLGACGAVLLAQARGARAAWRGAAVGLAAALIAARLPRLVEDHRRYAPAHPDPSACFARSEVDALARAVGGRAVDVTVPEVRAACVVLVEFGRRGVPVRFHEPAWTQLLCWTGWSPPGPGEKYELSLTGWSVWVEPSTVRFRNNQFQLCADRAGVTLASFRVPHFAAQHEDLGLHFWQGEEPSAFTIWNGTGRTQRVVFAADCLPGPSHPDQASRTALYWFGGHAGRCVLSAENGWQLRLPLKVSPGAHTLALGVQERATRPAGPRGPRDLLLLVARVRLETDPTGPAAGPDLVHRSGP